jgi:pimeloyl-ACP methyl ester carboxylesterase
MPLTSLNNINIYYEIHGKDEPFLFLNGLSSDISQKMPFINEAKKHFQVIVPDIRGSGQTDKPHAMYTIEEFAEDAYALLKELNIHKIPVMGFSMGGFIAQQLALTYPEIVAKLILIGTKPAWNKPLPPTPRAHALLHSIESSDKILTESFHILHGHKYKENVSVEQYVKTKLALPNPQPAHGYLGQLHACEHFDVSDKLEHLQQETLIVTGTADELIQAENSRWMHEQIPKAQLIEYPEIGHMLVDECPEKLIEDIISS